jgi:hypothetical protein
MEVERMACAEPIEIRSKGDGHVITGYAAVFGVESRVLGGRAGFREIVRPGAFDRSLAEGDDVIARSNHESQLLLGRTSSGTVRLSVDPKGLRYEIDVPNTTPGRDTLEYVRRGDIHESSFAFITRVKGDSWEKRASDGLPLRELLDVELVDVAPVIDQAAYPATQVSARTLEEAQKAVEPTPPAPGVPNEVNEARLRLQA